MDIFLGAPLSRLSMRSSSNRVMLPAPFSMATSTPCRQPHHASSFSHGFFLFGLLASVPCPSNTVGGISLIPGTGFPLVINSTMCAKDVG
jgi:hypothetical protein